MKAGTSTGLDADRGLNGIPPPLGWSSETARLLPHVFKGIDFAQKLYVLDVGSAQPKSIEFFPDSVVVYMSPTYLTHRF